MRQSPFEAVYSTVVGGGSTLLRTVTTTSSVASPPAPVAVTWKVSGPPFFGLVNVGLAVFAPVRVTAVPPVCFQAYVVASVERPASRLTATFWLTVWSAPAFATGRVAADRTWTVTVLDCGAPEPVTVSTKVSVASPFGTAGAVNVGWMAVLLLSVTAGPPVCSQL